MKKVFALALALAMVLSLASVAFAASNSELLSSDGSVNGYINVEPNQYYKWSSDDKVMKAQVDDEGNAKTPAFGNTVYFKMTCVPEEDLTDEFLDDVDDMTDEEFAAFCTADVTDSKQVSGLKITPKWTDGEKYVKSVEIVKKGGAYYVAVALTGSELDSAEVSGKIYLKGTSGTSDYKVKVDQYFTVELDVEYASVDKEEVAEKYAKKLYVSDTKTVYDLENVDYDEYTVYFGKETKSAIASAVVDVTNEEEVLLYYSIDEVESVVDAYPDANLDFVALTGKFKKTAEVTIYADEGTYLYKVVDGKVVPMDAEYDEWEEGFIFNAKTLGTYAISDVELKAAAVVETPEEGTDNPTTGAAA